MSSLAIAFAFASFAVSISLYPSLAMALLIIRDAESVEGPVPASTPRVVVGALLFSFLFLFILGAFRVATKRRATRHQPAIHLPLYPYRSQATGATRTVDDRDRGAIAIGLPAPPDSSASTSEISLRISEPSSRGSSTVSLAFPPALVTADQLLVTHRHAYDASSSPSGSEHSSGSSAGGSAPSSPSAPLLRISSIEVTTTRMVQN